MVLVLKHWKSRSSPGIIADGRGINPFTISKSRCRVSRAAAFSSLAHAGGRTHGAAGWSSPVARQAHNLKVVGSNPTPATNKIKGLAERLGPLFLDLAQFWHSKPKNGTARHCNSQQLTCIEYSDAPLPTSTCQM